MKRRRNLTSSRSYTAAGDPFPRYLTMSSARTTLKLILLGKLSHYPLLHLRCSLLQPLMLTMKSMSISHSVVCYQHSYRLLQLMCKTGDITAIRNGKVPLYPTDGGAAAGKDKRCREDLCHCSPPRTTSIP